MDQALKKKIAGQTNWEKDYWWMDWLLFPLTILPGYQTCKQLDDQQKKQNKQDKDNVLREGSAQRRVWLIQVDAKEKERLKTMKMMIENRAEALHEDLQDSAKKHNQISRSKKRELSQLNAIYQVVFSNKSLTINGINIYTYLNSLGGNS